MSGRIYIRVHWLHENSDEPVDLWSELDEQRFETRKIEIWRDGRVGFATRETASSGTMLGTEAVPPLAVIAADSEFSPEEITKDAFEECWSIYVR